jgi:hypothetical protein
MLSRSLNARWEKKGLRDFFRYRDLGIAEITDGKIGATIAKAFSPQRPEDYAPPHVHSLGFHMIFVLKGWLKTDFEELGEVVLREGDCLSYQGEVIQAHKEYSADYEVLQLTLPAEFPTKPIVSMQSGGKDETR